jgi:hypothetical protein
VLQEFKKISEDLLLFKARFDSFFSESKSAIREGEPFFIHPEDGSLVYDLQAYTQSSNLSIGQPCRQELLQMDACLERGRPFSKQ